MDIKELRKHYRLTQKALSDATGIPVGRINGWEQQGTKPKAEDQAKLDSFFASITGANGNITHAPAGRIPKRAPIGNTVNFYDVDFAAGDVTFYEDISAIKPAYTMDIPEFNGCTAFRVFGDSMEPSIVSGSIVFAVKVDKWQDHLEYGQIYGIVMKDKRKYLKYIRSSKENKKTHFLLKSENHELYDDFEIPKDLIRSIWLIHGWINKRT